MNNTILVLGGTGKTGRRVIDRLAKLSIPVRIGSRSISPFFDWYKEETWEATLAGIEKVYITFQPDIAIPQAQQIIQSFVQKAKYAGVQKLVLLSGRGEHEAELCENLVIKSGLDWTIVRASWFMQNFSEGFLLDSILAGEMILPKINADEPFVDADDIADVVVEALMDDAHSHQIYSLTGPTLLSFEKAISLIATAIKREIQYSEISMHDYTDMLRSYELSEEFISLISYLFTQVLDGRNEFTTNDVETVLNRKPTSFQEYINKTIKTGIWNQP